MTITFLFSSGSHDHFNFLGVAFLVALNQNGPLLGKDGLLPAKKYLSDIKRGSPGSTSYDLFQVNSSLVNYWNKVYHFECIGIRAYH